ncbi:MAG: 50S ribosomal protein L28 [Bacteroidales bacterium]|nr:50S ribosomal protein L28 [Bacteroidales bacterium]
MSKVCQVTGRKRMVGNNVSHSNRRTKRIFAINLKTKKFWSESEQRYVTLKVSAKGIRTIAKNGLDATIKASQDKGYVGLV